MRFPKLVFIILLAGLAASQVPAEQTNPVERQVANPITDTPNVNPISPEQKIAAPKPKKRPSLDEPGDEGEVVILAERSTAEGQKDSRIVHYMGNVDVHYGIYRLQADDIVVYEAETKMVASGSVIFDEGDDQRITGATAVWNYTTKLGTFEDSTGFTNQTDDGTVIYFSAKRVEKISASEIVVTKGVFTACEEAVPKWSFTADKAVIKVNDKLKLRNARFRLKDVPVLIVPYATIPIKKKSRASGFLTPTGGYSKRKGLRISAAYYQTLGESADVTFRGDVYTARGIGYGLDFRSRANSRSFFNAGFYAVKDRIFGHAADADHPDQGGSIVYAEGVHYFANGFTAAADFRLTSSLAFRQEFSEGVQQIISPIEVSQVFLNKSWGDYTLNLLARSQVISIPNVREKTLNLPSVSFEKRPSMLPFLKGLYFGFKTSFEGVSRREDVDDLARYQQTTGSDPTVMQKPGTRFDIYPQLTLPIYTKYFNFTATAAARVTYYSNSFDALRRVTGNDLVRKYGEFTFDLRPVALAKNYYGKNNEFRFRHVIEPFATYRLVTGVKDFSNIIRFDSLDTITDTNELEFGVTNRFYTRKYGQAVTPEAQKLLAAKTDTSKESLSIQPYELFTVTVRGKYFFDKTFGGALIPGQRNQIEPITALTFYTFGGVPRRFSPLNIDATYRPQKTVFVNARLDYGVQGDGLRAVSATVGYNQPMFKFFQTFYYTRAVTLIPSLAQYANSVGKEAGTLRGSQWSPSMFIGNRDHGLFGGTSFFFDFENRRSIKGSPMISSLFTVGYAYDCCSMALQYYTFHVGVRNENKFVFSFRLNGIGAFGSEQIGQGVR